MQDLFYYIKLKFEFQVSKDTGIRFRWFGCYFIDAGIYFICYNKAIDFEEGFSQRCIKFPVSI